MVEMLQHYPTHQVLFLWFHQTCLSRSAERHLTYSRSPTKGFGHVTPRSAPRTVHIHHYSTPELQHTHTHTHTHSHTKSALPGLAT